MTERPIERSGAPAQPEEPVAAPPQSGDAAAAREPGDAAPAARRGGAPPLAAWRRILGALFVVVVLVGITASPWWAPAIAPLLPWAPPAAPSELNARLDALEQRLAAAEKLLTQLVQRTGQDEAASAGTLAPLRESLERQARELQSLGNRLATLEKQPAQPGADPAALHDLQLKVGGLGEALAQLDAKVSKLAGAAEASGSRTDQAVLLALGQLRQAMHGSGPFAAELAAAMSLAQDRAEIKAALAPLAEAAARGLPSLAVLRQRFDGLAGPIADAAAAPPAASDWSDKIIAKLRALVSVRRVGPGVPSTGPEATVAAAESALAGDDLAGAVAALGTLHGPAMLAARDWLAQARSRLAAEAALEQATALATARLAAEQAPPPGEPGAKP